MAKAPQVRTKHPDEDRNCTVSFEHILDAGETLTGTPAVSFTPSGLTVSNQQVNAAELTIDGDTVPIGMAVKFKVSGGAHGVKYTGKAQCTTTSSPAQSPIVVFTLFVSSQG